MSPAPATLADIDRAIAELQERRAAELEHEKHRDELRKFLADRPLLNRVEVLRIAREMPGAPVRGKPIKSRHADRATGTRPANGDVGAMMQTAREAKGLSREALSKKLGVHNSSIGYWERGTGWPDPKHHKKIAGLLNIPVAKLTPPGGPRAKGSKNGRSTGKAPRSAADAKVGKAIAAAREAKGLDSLELADKLKVSPASVYAWENGQWSPGAEVAGRLAKLLAIPVDQLRPPKANGAAPH
jgi:ribosome-binding protein aMBF1 (putative translation factor)